MDTKNIKDEQIRKQIITASEVYRDKLAGRVFLYVYGESYFEVVFPTDRFRHLTGVNSSISAQEFYDKAKSSMLSAGQIFYDREHTYRGAKRKLPCLTMLPALTNNVVCVVKDMKTVTLTYKIGVTNLDFTIGLSENLDLEGNKINDWFLPRTLRVKDKAIESKETGITVYIICNEHQIDLLQGSRADLLADEVDRILNNGDKPLFGLGGIKLSTADEVQFNEGYSGWSIPYVTHEMNREAGVID